MTGKLSVLFKGNVFGLQVVILWHLPSAYRAPWQGQTPTPQRGKFRDATAAHCLVTGSYLSVQSKIIESFSPGGKKVFLVRLKTVEVILFLGLNTNTRRPQPSHLPPHRSCPPVLRPPTRCGPGAGTTLWSSTG